MSAKSLAMLLVTAGMAAAADTPCSSFAGNNADNCEFLTDLFESTNGAEWTDNKGWNTSTSVWCVCRRAAPCAVVLPGGPRVPRRPRHEHHTSLTALT
jgi:hypothetical protein